MPYKSDFADRLYEKVKDYARRWKSLAIEVAPPHLSGGIKYTTFKEGVKLGFEGSVKLTKGDDRSFADARAREFGSGIWSKKRRGTYPIYPRKKKLLAFKWETLSRGDLTKLEQGLWSRMKAAASVSYDDEGFFDPETFQNELRESGKYMGQGTDGRLFFSHVDHPGFKAANNGKGYMRYAMRLLRQDIKIAKDLTPALKREMQVIFTGKKLTFKVIE